MDPSTPPSSPTSSPPDHCRLDRRTFIASLSGAGLAGAVFAETLASDESSRDIDRAAIAAAEKLCALELSDSERDLMLEDLGELAEQYRALRQIDLPNHVPPALTFHPRPGAEPRPARSTPLVPISPRRGRPRGKSDLLYKPISELAALLRGGEVGSVELTNSYLERLETYGGKLECVIHLTRERALEEAERADRELAAGHDRGPLHGIPWGAKDLLAAKGTPTTWGAESHRGQVLDEDAAVVEKLTEAGAVLCAKLTLGALAWGDVWFGGKTRNPWRTHQGSSGSSAGSASATAAGLVGFSIGSETLGSIVSPCTRCGATGLRPTFGAVSRHGAMTLSWSMDKLGPICRSATDCALVMQAIHGPDPRDPSTLEMGFAWDPGFDISKLRVGYLKSAFDEEREDAEWRAHDLRTLEELSALGIELRPIELPDMPVEALSFILSAEAAAAFDELTRSGRDDLLIRQVRRAWPNVFRQARFIPAVEYIQANRARSLLMQQMAQLEKSIDVWVSPAYGGNNLLLTNLTGHPAVVLPNGFRDDGTPTSITLNGRLFGDGPLLALAQAYQAATDYHLRRPGPPYPAGKPVT